MPRARRREPGRCPDNPAGARRRHGRRHGPPERRARGADSPDYLTRARLEGRAKWVTYASLAAARAEIASLIGGGTASDNMLIYAREDKNRIDFYPVAHIEAGTALAELPWRKVSRP
ncbi:hypothetical protein [Arthrobacter sp. 9MFCol3.1]|uniref:hypothetical protein n=1 Tax=Arthrobacter sp. 9MFCol3.1 TaxID=1150398 RepID=UPI0012DC0C6B|nr:hypothetical protein [Arthrobacter sp. 9MFCol3.1]